MQTSQPRYFCFALMLAILTFGATAWGQLLNENFEYTPSTNLNGQGGWSAHSGTGTNPPQITTGGLTYPGYVSSGIGNAVSFTTNGEDNNRPFASYPDGISSGSAYYALMVRLDSAAAAGDYFFHLLKTSSTFSARIFAKRASNGNIQFGIGRSSTAANINYSDSVYSIGATYLLAVKYTVIAGATNDTVALWINPTIGSPEGTPTVLESSIDRTTTDVDTLYAVALRQGSAANAAMGTVDGIRVGTSWDVVVNGVQPPLTGTKTIPGDYATIAAAITDLNALGVGPGGVTFNVTAGHLETISATLSVTATGTASNPIVFQKSGAGANPLITAYGGGVGTPSTAVQDGILQLVGSDYITIDAIDLTDPNTTNPESMEYGYALYKASATNGCQNITISNCTITLNRVNNAAGSGPAVDGSRGIDVVNATPTAATTTLIITDAAGANSNNKFYSNTIQNCNVGIALIGFADVTPFTFADQNNDAGGASLATGNTIRNYGGGGATSPAAGVRTLAQYGVNISYNTINNNDGAGINHATTLRGIYNNTATSASATINNNTITVKSGATTSALTAIENAAGSTAAGNTISLMNNSISGNYLTATSGLCYGIFNSASASNVDIVGNTVSGISYSAAGLTGTGSLYSIYNTGAATNVNVLSNIVSNISRTGTTGGTTIGIFVSSGSNQTAKHNNVNTISIDGTGATSTMYGIQTSTGTIVVDSNVVNNLSCIKTTGTGTLYGIYNIASPTNENYNYNQVYNITHAGTGTTYGIYAFTTTGTRTVSNNLVHSISTGGTTIAGINQSSSSPNIFKNKIYNIQSGSTGAPTVSGIGLTSVGTAGTANIYNNLIGDLKAPNASTSAVTAPSVRGINITAVTASSSLNVSFNSVYLNASSVGANFGTTGLFVTTSTTATTAALMLRNNNIVNHSTPAGTGLAVAYQRSTTALDNYTSASNNNLFYGGTPGAANLIFFDGTNSDQTIAAFKSRVSPREGSSITENPTFLSTTGSDPTFLHINTTVATQIESGGLPVAGISDDYDGDLRNSTAPDIGADEFAGIGVDLSPPNISYTALLNTGSTGARTLTSTIADPSGVPTAGIGLPVLYWRINSGAYSPATATSLGSNQYEFTFGSGVSINDTVRYYIAAQDGSTPPNVGVQPSGGASGFTPDPPAASTPPTSPSSYLVVQLALSGDYTVGLTFFNRLSGRNLVHQAGVRKVMREVQIPVATKEKIPSEPLALTADGYRTEFVEADEQYSMLTENGLPYSGPNKIAITPEMRAQFGLSNTLVAIYPTITAAIADLNLRGVSGHTNFILVDATYPSETFPITVDVANSSAPNASATVTLKPNTGIAATVSGTSSTAILKLNGADYFTLDGLNTGGSSLTLSNTNTATSTAVIWIGSKDATNGATNNTVKNCTIRGSGGLLTAVAVLVGSGTTFGGLAESPNSNLTIMNNTINNSQNAVFSTGNATTFDDNMLISSNSFGSSVASEKHGFRGMLISNAQNSMVTQNVIRGVMSSTTSSATMTGIQLSGTLNNVTISRNDISDIKQVNTTGWGSNGIFGATTAGTNVMIVNNFIYDVASDGFGGVLQADNGYGLVFNTGTGYKAYYNTVNMTTNQVKTSGIPAALMVASGITVAGTLDIRNNIFINNQSVGTFCYGALVQSTNAVFGSLDYNDYYASDATNGRLGRFGATVINDLPTWRASTGADASSISANVNFLAPTNLHVVTSLPSPVDGAATPIAGVTTDIDGNTRNATNPDIGGDEFTYSPPPLAGLFTIGSGGSFATLSLAVYDLQTRGVSAPVTFEFTDAAYTDTAQIIGGYPGQGTSNLVTFKPASGVTSRIFVTGGANTFAVRMDSASGITWDGSNSGGLDRSLTIECDTIAPSRNVFLIRKGSNNLTFKNLILKGNRRSSTSSNDVFRMDNQTFASSGPQHDITVDNCHLLRGLGGVFARGASGAVLDYNLNYTRNLVGGGDGAPLLDNLAGTGILLEANRNVLVDQNEINGIKVAGTPQGVRIQGANDGVTMTRNRIHNIVTLSGAFRPLCLLIGNIVGTGPAVKTRAVVANNMWYDIHNFGTGASGRAVDGIIYNPTGPPNSANGNGSTIEFYNNTWNIDYATGEGTGTTNFIFDANFAGSNTTPGHVDSITFINNVASSRRADSLASRMWLIIGPSGFPGSRVIQSDNNVYYYNVGPFAQIPSPWPDGGTAFFANDLQQFRDTTGLDLNSITGDPQFLSATNAHIRNNAATPVESRGTPIAAVTVDIDGDARNASTPDAGADEGAFVPYVLGNISAAFDSITAQVALSWSAPSNLLRASEIEHGKISQRNVITEKILLISSYATNPADWASIIVNKQGQMSEVLYTHENVAHITTPANALVPSGDQTPIHLMSERVNRSGVSNFAQVFMPEPSEADLGINHAAQSSAMLQSSLMFHHSEWINVENGTVPNTTATLDQFRIYRSQSGGPFQLIDSVSGGVSSYSDTRVQALQYSYYLVAEFNDGTSQPSATVGVNVPYILNEVELNNSSATANQMTIGYQVGANLTPAGDLDWYRFSAPVGHLVADGSDPSNATDVVIRLYDSTGTALLYEVDRNLNDRLEYNLQYAGVYYVRVSGFNNATGPYTLFARIDAATDPGEPDDGPLLGFPLVARSVNVVGYRDSLSTINPGVGLPGFDLDYRWFTLTPGQQVTAILRTKTTFPSSSMNGGYVGIGRKGSGASLIPQLFGGSPLASGFSTTGTNVTVAFTATVADTYYVFVSVHLQAPSPYGFDQAGPNARYDLSLDRTVDVGGAEEIPTVYALGQNYPNPFNPTTIIRYALPEASTVSLKIYNVLGQQVAELVNDVKSAGFFQTQWNGRNQYGQLVSSGVYFYRMEAHSTNGGNIFVSEKKMLLLK